MLESYLIKYSYTVIGCHNHSCIDALILKESSDTNCHIESLRVNASATQYILTGLQEYSISIVVQNSAGNSQPAVITETTLQAGAYIL